MSKASPPDLRLESALWAEGCALVCGVDEVGRGPLAGPVVAAAVIFPPQIDLVAAGLATLDDSKKLSEIQRKKIVPLVRKLAVAVGVAVVSPREIDRLNIRQASLLAMKNALAELASKPDYILIDGRDLPDDLGSPGRAVIRGDSISATIAAASVIAKVHRDAIMLQLSEKFPVYGWQTNRGYPTKVHRQALLQHGVTEHHRYSFAPVKKLLQ